MSIVLGADCRLRSMAALRPRYNLRPRPALRSKADVATGVSELWQNAKNECRIIKLPFPRHGQNWVGAMNKATVLPLPGRLNKLLLVGAEALAFRRIAFPKMICNYCK